MVENLGKNREKNFFQYRTKSKKCPKSILQSHCKLKKIPSFSNLKPPIAGLFEPRRSKLIQYILC